MEVSDIERRVIKTEPFLSREENGKRYIEGYFSVFNVPYEVCPGWIEEVAPGAFSRTIREGKDVKVLWNHNSDIVLGSTSNMTATLGEDEHGLRGKDEINEDDQDAKNGYARIARGDVTGCSFGFDIREFEESWDDDGTYRTRLLDVELYEVSPCTFPAYTQTNIQARAKEQLAKAKEKLEQKRQERNKQWQAAMLAKLRK